MPKRMRVRRPRSWLVAFCVAVGLGSLGATNASAATAPCETQVNDTPAKLLPCIQTDDLWHHMQAFEAIAMPIQARPTCTRRATPVNPVTWRRSNYVVDSDEGRPDTTSLSRPYTFTYYAYKEPPTFERSSPTPHSVTHSPVSGIPGEHGKDQ